MSDAQNTIPYTMNLPEGQGRIYALEQVARMWAEKDPAAVSKWIEKSSLSQDEKDTLLKNIPKK